MKHSKRHFNKGVKDSDPPRKKPKLEQHLNSDVKKEPNSVARSYIKKHTVKQLAANLHDKTSNHIVNSQVKKHKGNHKDSRKSQDSSSKPAASYVKIKREANQPTPKLPKAGRKTFKWMIDPVEEKEFFEAIWEQQPLLVKRHDPNYYKKLFSSSTFNLILQKRSIQFTENLDITSYKDGKRETHNPEGRAYPTVVWDWYKNHGCSVRMLNPQTYSNPVWRLCAALQDYFHSFTGCNMYLTPPDSQGFAPHFDDIEAFVLQIEGSKLWKVYPPRNEQETFPLYSSRNFTQKELGGPPALTVTLHPGDLLYFPRGWLHQAASCNGQHSLHLTISTYQHHSWADLLAAALPTALANIPQLRQGLPRGVFSLSPADLGAAASQLLSQLPPLDLTSGLDKLARGLLHSSLPPYLSPVEKSQSVLGRSPRWGDPGPPFHRTTLIRLVRRHCCRVVREEDGELRLYHSLANSRVYRETEPQYVELEEDISKAVAFLNSQYPQWAPVAVLPLGEDMDLKVYIANELFKQGLLLAKN